MSQQQTMLRTENLTVRYGSLVAVDAINLEVPTGAIFGFIGPNGAGKTTTMRVLATLLEPDAGRAWVSGHDVIESPQEAKKLIGYMPDFFGVYDHLFVWEYLELFGELYHMPRPKLQTRITDVLEACELEGKREALVGGLSRGMKQRLCLAKALLTDPPVLILDEPASGVDPKGRYEMRQLLRRLGEQGKTILVSSHILLELAEVCDYVGIIEAGKLRSSGPLEELVAASEAGRMLHLRLVGGGTERAAQVLQRLTAVRETKAHEEVLSVRIPDQDEVQAEVLACLVTEGFRIGHVTEEHTNLEEIYYRLTRGELA
jgi:ABC-2 type transport system ATP-binding protein